MASPTWMAFPSPPWQTGAWASAAINSCCCSQRQQKADAAAVCRFVNADGSFAGQCGNGLRGIALYLQRCGEFTDKGLRLLCNGKAVTVHTAADNCFKVDMGPPGSCACGHSGCK